MNIFKRINTFNFEDYIYIKKNYYYIQKKIKLYIMSAKLRLSRCIILY